MANTSNKNGRSILSIGSKVHLKNRLSGRIAYIGLIEKKSKNKNDLFYGIKLNKAKGKNNGCVNGKKYFKCKEKYGLFVKKNKIILDNKTIKKLIGKTFDNLNQFLIHLLPYLDYNTLNNMCNIKGFLDIFGDIIHKYLPYDKSTNMISMLSDSSEDTYEMKNRFSNVLKCLISTKTVNEYITSDICKEYDTYIDNFTILWKLFCGFGLVKLKNTDILNLCSFCLYIIFKPNKFKLFSYYQLNDIKYNVNNNEEVGHRMNYLTDKIGHSVIKSKNNEEKVYDFNDISVNNENTSLKNDAGIKKIEKLIIFNDKNNSFKYKNTKTKCAYNGTCHKYNNLSEIFVSSKFKMNPNSKARKVLQKTFGNFFINGLYIENWYNIEINQTWKENYTYSRNPEPWETKTNIIAGMDNYDQLFFIVTRYESDIQHKINSGDYSEFFD